MQPFFFINPSIFFPHITHVKCDGGQDAVKSLQDSSHCRNPLSSTVSGNLWWNQFSWFNGILLTDATKVKLAWTQTKLQYWSFHESHWKCALLVKEVFYRFLIVPWLKVLKNIHSVFTKKDWYYCYDGSQDTYEYWLLSWIYEYWLLITEQSIQRGQFERELCFWNRYYGMLSFCQVPLFITNKPRISFLMPFSKSIRLKLAFQGSPWLLIQGKQLETIVK